MSTLNTVQGSAKRRASGLVKFVPAVAYHSCLPCLQHSRNLGPPFSRALYCFCIVWHLASPTRAFAEAVFELFPVAHQIRSETEMGKCHVRTQHEQRNHLLEMSPPGLGQMRGPKVPQAKGEGFYWARNYYLLWVAWNWVINLRFVHPQKAAERNFFHPDSRNP